MKRTAHPYLVLVMLLPFVGMQACSDEDTTNVGTGGAGTGGGGAGVGGTGATTSTSSTTTSTSSTTSTVPCLDVTDYGAVGDGVANDTAAIQAAVDAAANQGGGTVCVPDGTFLVDPDVSINMASGTNLSLAANATLQAIPTSSENYAVVQLYEVSGVEITGGHIVGERDTHTGTTGEWGMCLNIVGSSNVHVDGLSVADCWGDGIYVGAGTQGYCENVIIENFTSDNNRRQGISVITAKTLTIRNGTISNTHGTAPEAGIDLEPNQDTELLLDVLIENVHTENNASYGIMAWLGNFPPPPATGQLKITLTGDTDTGSADGALGNLVEYAAQGYDITIN
jgi:hypothetical protein